MNDEREKKTKLKIGIYVYRLAANALTMAISERYMTLIHERCSQYKITAQKQQLIGAHQASKLKWRERAQTTT